MNNFILIDKNLPQNNVLINSFQPDSIYFNYDYTSTSDDIYNFLLNNNITHIERICLIFASTGHRPVKFINNSPLFITSDINKSDKSDNFNLIINLLNTLQPTHIDFLACNLLKYSSYTNYFQSIIDISTNKNLLVGASSDRTGNIKYGGDWILENTKENIQNIYFNSNITNYTQLLDYNMYLNTNVFSLESLEKDLNGNYIDENGDIVENRIPTGKYQIQSWGNAVNSGGDSRELAALGLDVNISMVYSNDGNSIYVYGSAFAALTTGGNVVVWGNPYCGGSSVYGDPTTSGYIYTGDGKNDNKNKKLSDVVKIYSTMIAFAALLSDGSVFVWGDPCSGGSSVYYNPDYHGFIFTGNGKNNGNDVNGNKLLGVKKIYSTTYAFAAIIGDNKNVFVWGDPLYGGSSVYDNDTYRGFIYDGDGSILSDVEKIYSTDNAFAAIIGDNKNVFVWGDPFTGGSSVYGDPTTSGFIYDGDGKYDNNNNNKLLGVVKIYSTFRAFAAIIGDNKNVFVWGDPSTGGSSVWVDEFDHENQLDPVDKYRGFIYDGDAKYDNNNNKLSGVVKIYSTGYGAFAAIIGDNKNVFVWGNPSAGGSSVYDDDKYPGFIFTGNGINNDTGNGSILLGVEKIYSGYDAFAALTTHGSVFVWGNPFYGGSSVWVDEFDHENQLNPVDKYRGFIYDGDGKYDNNNNNKLLGVVKIYSTGYGAFAALTTDSSVFVWGNPSAGGSSVYDDDKYPGFIFTGNGINNDTGNGSILLGVVKIYSSAKAFAALLSNGTVFVWGNPEFGGALEIYNDNDNDNPQITPLSVKPNYKKFIFGTRTSFCEMAQYDNNIQIPYFVKIKGDYPKGISQDTLIYAVNNNIPVSCNNL